MSMLKKILRSISRAVSFTRTVAVITVAAFVVTSVIGPAAYALNAPMPGAAQKIKESLSAFQLPYSVGRITDAKYLGSKKVVVAIQDLHCHPEVQRNIAKILGILDGKFGNDSLFSGFKVFVEGGVGAVDTSWVTKVSDPKVREGAVETLMNAGRLTGSEYYSIKTGKYSLLQGLEDAKPYYENLARLNEIMDRRGAIAAQMPEIKAALEKVKALYYTAGNKRLDQIAAKHEARAIETEKYYKLLLKLGNRAEIDPYYFPATANFLEIMALQRQLRYKSIDRELKKFISSLKEKVPFGVYNQLIEKASRPNGLEEMYVTLAQVGAGMDLSAYPALAKFFVFVEKNQKMNPLDLVREERMLIGELRGRLSQSRAEREVAFIADFLQYVQAYYENKMSADDYAYYTKNAAEFQQLWRRYAGAKLLPSLDGFNGLFAKYYGVNIERNRIFLGKIGVEAAAGKPALAANSVEENIFLMNTQLSMAEAGNEVAVVVTGGFHTQGLSRMLEEKGISYVVITPNVTGDTAFAQRMYDIFAREFAAGSASPAVTVSSTFGHGSTAAEALSEDSLGLPEISEQLIGMSQEQILSVPQIVQLQAAAGRAAVAGLSADHIAAALTKEPQLKGLFERIAADGNNVVFTFKAGHQLSVAIANTGLVPPAIEVIPNAKDVPGGPAPRLMLPATVAVLQGRYPAQAAEIDRVLGKQYASLTRQEKAFVRRLLREGAAIEHPQTAVALGSRAAMELFAREHGGTEEATAERIDALLKIDNKILKANFSALALIAVVADALIAGIAWQFGIATAPEFVIGISVSALLIANAVWLWLAPGQVLGAKINNSLINYFHYRSNIHAKNRLMGPAVLADAAAALVAPAAFGIDNASRIVRQDERETTLTIHGNKVTVTIGRAMGILSDEELLTLVNDVIALYNVRGYPEKLNISFGDASSVDVRDGAIVLDKSLAAIQDYNSRRLVLRTALVVALGTVFSQQKELSLDLRTVEYAVDRALEYGVETAQLARTVEALPRGMRQYGRAIVDRITEIDVPLDTLDVSPVLAELTACFGSDGAVDPIAAVEFIRKYSWAVQKQVNAGNRVEGAWPVAKAFALLSAGRQSAFIDFIVTHYVQGKTGRLPALLDALLLMSADRNKGAEKYKKQWLKRQAWTVAGRPIYYVSAETHFWAGGLGPVMQFHGLAMNDLGGAVRFIEPKYHLRYDNPEQKAMELDYADMGVIIEKEIDSFPVDAFVWRDGEDRQKTVTAKVYEGVNDAGVKVYLIQDFDENGNTFFTSTLYHYREFDGRNADKPSKSEFMAFFDKASAQFIERQEQARFKSSPEDFVPAIIHANDGQTGPLLAIVKSMKSPALAGAILAFTTHTFRNRVNYFSADLLTRWMGISPRYLPFAATSKDGNDASSLAIRIADWVNGVAEKHVRTLAEYNPYDSMSKSPIDTFSKIVSITNAAAPRMMASVFRAIVTRADFVPKLAKGQNIDEPTPDQIEAAKVIAKKDLNARKITSSTDKKVNISETAILFTYCRRMVPEKAGRDRALTDENIVALVEQGASVVLFGADQGYYDSSRLADSLQNLQQEIENGYFRGRKLSANRGAFFYVRNYTGDEKKALLAASNVQVQDSDQNTGANEFTEEDIAANAGINYGSDEGTIIRHGILMKFNDDGTVAAQGNVLMVPFDGPFNYPMAHRKLLLNLISLYQHNSQAFFECCAIAPRVNRANNYGMTGSAYLSESHGFIENTRIAQNEDNAVIEAILASVDPQMLSRIAEGDPSLPFDPFGFDTAPGQYAHAANNGLKKFIEKKKELQESPQYAYGQFMRQLTDKRNYEDYIIALFGGRQQCPPELIEWFARLNNSPAAADKKNARFDAFITSLVAAMEAPATVSLNQTVSARLQSAAPAAPQLTLVENQAMVNKMRDDRVREWDIQVALGTKEASSALFNWPSTFARMHFNGFTTDADKKLLVIGAWILFGVTYAAATVAGIMVQNLMPISPLFLDYLTLSQLSLSNAPQIGMTLVSLAATLAAMGVTAYGVNIRTHASMNILAQLINAFAEVFNWHFRLPQLTLPGNVPMVRAMEQAYKDRGAEVNWKKIWKKVARLEFKEFYRPDPRRSYGTGLALGIAFDLALLPLLSSLPTFFAIGVPIIVISGVSNVMVRYILFKPRRTEGFQQAHMIAEQDKLSRIERDMYLDEDWMNGISNKIKEIRSMTLNRNINTQLDVLEKNIGSRKQMLSQRGTLPQVVIDEKVDSLLREYNVAVDNFNAAVVSNNEGIPIAVTHVVDQGEQWVAKNMGWAWVTAMAGASVYAVAAVLFIHSWFMVIPVASTFLFIYLLMAKSILIYRGNINAHVEHNLQSGIPLTAGSKDNPPLPLLEPVGNMTVAEFRQWAEKRVAEIDRIKKGAPERIAFMLGQERILIKGQEVPKIQTGKLGIHNAVEMFVIIYNNTIVRSYNEYVTRYNATVQMLKDRIFEQSQQVGPLRYPRFIEDEFIGKIDLSNIRAYDFVWNSANGIEEFRMQVARRIEENRKQYMLLADEPIDYPSRVRTLDLELARLQQYHATYEVCRLQYKTQESDTAGNIQAVQNIALEMRDLRGWYKKHGKDITVAYAEIKTGKNKWWLNGGYIKQGLENSEIRSIRAQIKRDSEVVRDGNRTAVEAVVKASGELLKPAMLGGLPEGLRKPLRDILADPEKNITWMITRVYGPEKYILGHDRGLAVDIIEAMLAVKDDALLKEYILHEMLESVEIPGYAGDAKHNYIIALTQQLFYRGEPARPNGETALGTFLRAFIDVKAARWRGSNAHEQDVFASAVAYLIRWGILSPKEGLPLGPDTWKGNLIMKAVVARMMVARPQRRNPWITAGPLARVISDSTPGAADAAIRKAKDDAREFGADVVLFLPRQASKDYAQDAYVKPDLQDKGVPAGLISFAKAVRTVKGSLTVVVYEGADINTGLAAVASLAGNDPAMKALNPDHFGRHTNGDTHFTAIVRDVFVVADEGIMNRANLNGSERHPLQVVTAAAMNAVSQAVRDAYPEPDYVATGDAMTDFSAMDTLAQKNNAGFMRSRPTNFAPVEINALHLRSINARGISFIDGLKKDFAVGSNDSLDTLLLRFDARTIEAVRAGDAQTREKLRALVHYAHLRGVRVLFDIAITPEKGLAEQAGILSELLGNTAGALNLDGAWVTLDERINASAGDAIVKEMDKLVRSARHNAFVGVAGNVTQTALAAHNMTRAVEIDAAKSLPAGACAGAWVRLNLPSGAAPSEPLLTRIFAEAGMVGFGVELFKAMNKDANLKGSLLKIWAQGMAQLQRQAKAPAEAFADGRAAGARVRGSDLHGILAAFDKNTTAVDNFLRTAREGKATVNSLNALPLFEADRSPLRLLIARAQHPAVANPQARMMEVAGFIQGVMEQGMLRQNASPDLRGLEPAFSDMLAVAKVQQRLYGAPPQGSVNKDIAARAERVEVLVRENKKYFQVQKEALSVMNELMDIINRDDFGNKNGSVPFAAALLLQLLPLYAERSMSDGRKVAAEVAPQLIRDMLGAA